MAHLTCTTHKRRVHLSDSLPGVVMHRSDLSRCDFNVPVVIRGQTYIPTLVVTNRDWFPNLLSSSDPLDVLDDFPLPKASRKDRPRKKTKK